MTINRFSPVLLVLLILKGIPLTQAQQRDVGVFERIRLESQWQHGNVGAGMTLDSIASFRNVELTYEHTSGKFRSPLSGEKEQNINVTAQEYIRLKELRLWGKFSFLQNLTDSAGYNASISDPFRGMPYYVIDPYRSDWRKQLYDLQFCASLPLPNRRILLGMRGGYHAGLAAKQRDPRVDTRTFTLCFSPSLVYVPSSRHRLGLGIDFRSMKEDSQMRQESYSKDQEYFELYGLGHAIRGLGGGRVTDYKGLCWGLQGQYQYDHPLFLAQGSILGTSGVEDVFFSFSMPRKDASLLEKRVESSVTFLSKGKEVRHRIQGQVGWHERSGIQYMNKRDASESSLGWIRVHGDKRSVFVDNEYSLHYTVYRPLQESYRWLFETNAGYLYSRDTYLLPHSAQEYRQWMAEIRGNHVFDFGDRRHTSLLAQVRGGYIKTFQREFVYGSLHEDYTPPKQLETQNFAFLTSSSLDGECALTLTTDVPSLSHTRTYLRLLYRGRTALRSELGSRTTWNASVGFLF